MGGVLACIEEVRIQTHLSTKIQILFLRHAACHYDFAVKRLVIICKREREYTANACYLELQVGSTVF